MSSEQKFAIPAELLALLGIGAEEEPQSIEEIATQYALEAFEDKDRLKLSIVHQVINNHWDLPQDTKMSETEVAEHFGFLISVAYRDRDTADFAQEKLTMQSKNVEAIARRRSPPTPKSKLTFWG